MQGLFNGRGSRDRGKGMSRGGEVEVVQRNMGKGEVMVMICCVVVVVVVIIIIVVVV